ncbi:MarR family winged helix-turn-helix transcriptional regulator [Gallaecimonas mangrovi]|uniref:MarR family winged helix-turn-helix transcriptional regulator n=1 Tax=Gallaecimonas mangrovi TaxID=2291597 RepID=UPI001868C82D|nr:MarR family winged helix-turn-helix transcriptional regulator [Gallaecimonas mangrovi]
MPKQKGNLVPPNFLIDAYSKELSPEVFQSIRLLFSLREAVQRVNADLAQWLGSDALSPGRMQMLMILWAKKDSMLQRDLVEVLGVSRASVSELVELLSRDGLVKTKPDPHHGRRLHVALTTAGRALAARQIRDNGNRLDTAFGDLSSEQKQQLIEQLDKLCPVGSQHNDKGQR